MPDLSGRVRRAPGAFTPPTATRSIRAISAARTCGRRRGQLGDGHRLGAVAAADRRNAVDLDAARRLGAAEVHRTASRPTRPSLPVVDAAPSSAGRWRAAKIKKTIGSMEDYGLPKPDHEPLDAHPSVSGEFLTRAGCGDIMFKPASSALDGRRRASSPTAARRRSTPSSAPPATTCASRSSTTG